MLNEEARQKILNLPVDTNKRFEDIENLKEVPNIPYVTNTGEYTIENSKKGYLTNVNIQGKTLVNIIDKTTYYRNVNTGKHFMKVSYSLKNFTIKNYSNLGIYIAIHNSDNVWVRDIFIDGENLSYIELLDGEIISGIQGIVSAGWSEEDADKFKSSCIIIEGNYTTKDISYFEGLQSVGQGDKIEILTTEINNSNLIKSDYIYTNGKYNSLSGEYLDTDDKHYACEEFIEVKGNTEYVFYGLNGNRQYYDSNKNFIQGISSPEQHFQLTRNSSWRYWVEKTPSNAHFIKVTLHVDNLINGKAMLFEGNKFDKKIILYTLRSLPDGTKDEIVYKNNKYYLIKRCEEVILDGNENWIEVHGMYEFRLNLDISVLRLDMSKFITNLYKQSYVDYIYNVQTESALSISTENGIGVIDIVDTSISPFSIANFKEKLKKNPLKIIYELETPREIELGLLNLEQYDNQIRFICNSGIVIPNISFESTQNLGSHIEAIRDNIKNMQSKNIIIDLSNKLLNGWKRTVSDNDGFIISKNGNQVSFHMRITGGIITDSTALLKLPDGFTPKTFYVFPIFTTQNNQLVQGFMYFNFANGYIQITQLGSNKDIYSYGTYFIE
ncbi:TPA: hypothetical protein ACG3O0_003807 [Clostridioides difficile]|nr:hypothetical protein [Clostridioides difficile]